MGLEENCDKLKLALQWPLWAVHLSIMSGCAMQLHMLQCIAVLNVYA